MRLALATAILAASLFLPGSPARAFTDAELIDGFNRSVFGSEFRTWGRQSRIVKKFVDPVRFHVDDRSASGRRGAALRFIRSLAERIDGLEVRVVNSPAMANFRVIIVDRRDYRHVVAREILGRPSAAFVPGKCIVRVASGRIGIARSDAVIVADQGEFLFNRCLVEEVLQGLGPVNDDATLAHSVFNDASRHSSFTRFDRHLLNMLYHPKIRAGARQREVAAVLPAVAAEVRARIR